MSYFISLQGMKKNKDYITKFIEKHAIDEASGKLWKTMLHLVE